MKTLVSQVDVLETMTPLSFNSFRPRLESASGFQSAQFREVEFIMGHRRAGMVDHHPAGSPARARLEDRLVRPTLYQSFLRYLAHCGQPVPTDLLEAEVPETPEEHEVMQDLLLDVYRNDPTLAQICERLVDLDEGFQEWRYRHVKMVERTIGAKVGTGGSAGTEYLRATLFRPFFPDLWAIRSRM